MLSVIVKLTQDSTFLYGEKRKIIYTSQTLYSPFSTPAERDKWTITCQPIQFIYFSDQENLIQCAFCFIIFRKVKAIFTAVKLKEHAGMHYSSTAKIKTDVRTKDGTARTLAF